MQSAFRTAATVVAAGSVGTLQNLVGVCVPKQSAETTMQKPPNSPMKLASIRPMLSRLCRSSLLTVADFSLLAAAPARADESFQQAVRLLVWPIGPTPGGGTVTISFVSCSSAPIGPCATPIPGGCAPAECSIVLDCTEPDADAMAVAVADAINAMGCESYAATFDGMGLVSLFYPNDICLCIGDSISGETVPYSRNCGGVIVCDNAWLFDFGFLCPTLPPDSCVALEDFSEDLVVLDFDAFPSGTILSTEFPGLVFENTEVDANAFAVSLPNRIITDTSLPFPRPSIRVTFDIPVIRAGANIDSDGFTGERKPQLRVCGATGRVEMCDFGQGPDFQAIALPDCERIVALELGSINLGTCVFEASDGFDNLTYDSALCGDMDDDGDFEPDDIAIFVAVLICVDLDPCHINRADINLDGKANGLDIQPFVDCVVP